MRERDIQASIKQFLEFNKCLVLRQNSGKWQDARTGSWIQGADLGTPDLIVGIPHNGIVLLCWVEVKSETGSLSVEQIHFLRKIHKIGCPWVVANSVQDVERWIKELSTYHGKTKYVSDVLDGSQRFIPSKIKSKKSKMSLSTVNEFNRWADKYRS